MEKVVEEPEIPPEPAGAPGAAAAAAAAGLRVGRAKAKIVPGRFIRVRAPASAQAKALAKNPRLSITAIRKRAKTTVNVVLEMLCSKYLNVFCHMIVTVAEPLQREHTNLIQFLTSAERVQQWYGQSAVGLWRHTVCALHSTLFDLQALKKCGFVTDMAPLTEEDMVPKEDVDAQDIWAEEMHRMVVSQSMFRVWTGMEMSLAYPMFFAALALYMNNKEYFPIYKRKVFQSLKAWRQAKTQPHDTVKQMVAHSFWNTGFGWFVRTIMEYGSDGDFLVLCTYFALLFAGQGMAYPIEVANRYVKEHVMRLRASTQARMAELWGLARQKGLMASMGRPEVAITTTMPVPKEIPPDLFDLTPEVVSEEKGDTEFSLKNLTKDPATWCNNRSNEHLVVAAQDHVLQVWMRKNVYFPEKLWNCCMLPKWEVVEDERVVGKLIFVLAHVKRVAAIAYIIKEDERGFIRLPTDPTQLHPFFLIVDNWKRWRVIPTRVVSPLGMRWIAFQKENLAASLAKSSASSSPKGRGRAKGAKRARTAATPAAPPPPELGIVLRRDPTRNEEEKKMPLDKWHKENGFQELDSDTLADLINTSAIPKKLVDAAARKAYNQDCANALAYLLQDADYMMMFSIICALRVRRKSLKGVDVRGLRALLDDDCLLDLVVKEDMHEMREFIQENEAAEQDTKEMRKHARAHVEDAFKQILSKEDFKKALKQLKADTKISIPWDGALQLGLKAREYLDALGPPMVKITMQKKGGCFTVTSGRRYVRSFSWTRVRTPGQALKLTLLLAWDTWNGETGEDIPKEITTMIQQIKDDVDLGT